MQEIKTPNLTSKENKPLNLDAGSDKLQANPKISVAPTIKPLLEGINTPVTASPIIGSSSLLSGLHLTEAEKKLINSPIEKQVSEDPRQMSRQLSVSAVPKSHGFGMFIFGFLVASLVWVSVIWFEKPQGILELIKIPTSPSVVSNVMPESDIPLSSETPIQAVSVTASSSTPENILPNPGQEPANITQLKIKSTPTGYLNVRSEPSTAGLLVGKVNPGDIFTYTNKKSGWYEIVLPENKTGWVIETYTEVAPSK